MMCPFYGFAALPTRRVLANCGGNRCAIITDANAPCRMEIDGKPPELENCVFNGTGQAEQFATFERHLFTRERNMFTSSDYPD